jgi:glycosyltransferase involved in cell wall biosynthesis
MEFSLIVATRDRTKELEKFLLSACDQVFRNFEIIIIDQSNLINQELNSKVVASVKGAGLNIRHKLCEGKGLSRARNIGLELAQGRILAFPDDDCWYSSHVLKNVHEAFKGGQFSFLSGQYSEPGIENRSFPPKSLPLNSLLRAGIPASVTLFVFAAAIETLKFRFDENIGAGTSMPIGEETDLVYSLIENDFKGYYDNSLVIFHPLPDLSRKNAVTNTSREVARGYVLGKHSQNPTVAIYSLLGLLKIMLKSNRFIKARARITGLRLGRQTLVNSRLAAAS